MQIFKRLPHILCIYALVNNTSEFDFVFSLEIISCAQRVFTTKMRVIMSPLNIKYVRLIRLLDEQTTKNQRGLD